MPTLVTLTFASSPEKIATRSSLHPLLLPPTPLQLATPIGTALFYCTGVIPAIVIMAVLYIRMFLFVRAATSVKDRAKETAAAVTAGGGAGSLTLTNGSNLTSESCRTDTSGSMGGSLAASKFDYSSAEPSSATAETGVKGKSSFSNGASASSSSTSFLALFSPLSHNFNLFKRSVGAASAAVHPSAPPPALTDYSAVLLRVTSKRLSARRISSIAIPEPPTSAHRGDVDSAGSADDGAMSDDICDTERSHGGSALSHAGQLCESVTAPQANSQRQKEAAAGAGRASSQSIVSDSRDCRSSSSNHTNSNEEEGVSASLLAPPSKGNTGCGSGSSGVVAAAAAGVGTPHTPSTPVDEALALKRKIADDAVKLAAAVYRAAREARRTRRHWQVAKRAMAFFFCFVACWWPFIMITMVEWITGYVPTPAVDLIGAQLGHLNTFFNALLHLYFNASFRNEALRLLASCVAFLGCRSMAERFAPPAKQPHRRASGSSGKSSTPTMNVAVAQRHAARRGSLDGGSGTGGFAAGGYSKKGIHSGSASCTVPPPPEEPKVGSSSISDDAETTSAVSAATETAMTIVKISGGSSSPRSPSTTSAGPSTTTAITTPSPAVRGGGKGGARPPKFRRGSMAPLMDSEPIDTPPTTPTAAASESPSAAALPAHPGSVGASSDINESMGSSRAVVTSVRRTSPRQPPSDDPSPRQSPSHGGNDDLTSPRKSPRLADQLLHSDAGGSARGRSIVVAATSTSAATSSKTIPLYSSTSSTAALST